MRNSESRFVIEEFVAENVKYPGIDFGFQMDEIRNLRTAAIGVGSLGRHHARNYAELAREGRVEFVGACDFDPATLKAVSADNGCGSFSSWKDLIDLVDAVSIATPTETHSEIACAFLERGIHVLVEKPIAQTLEEADLMISAARSSGAKLMVGQLERFNPAMVALRPHVTKPLYFEIHRVSPFPNRSLDVDVVLDVMIHDLDAVQWLVGEDVKVSGIHAVGIPVLRFAMIFSIKERSSNYELWSISGL
jgi:predicted dehydrogenase